MQSSWQLNGTQAIAQWGPLRARLDLAAPRDGVRIVAFDEQEIDARLFALPSLLLNAAPLDQFVRGNDLVAVYESTGERPLRVEVYWRLGDEPAMVAADAAGWIDLQISVQTPVLDALPELEVATILPHGEVWQLTAIDAAEFCLLADPARKFAAAPPPQPAECLLFRPASFRGSYAQMVPPTDYRRVELDASPGNGWRLAHHLFPHTLEKGVILRARIRSAFVSRENDFLVARELFRRLLSEPLPLTA